MVKVYTDEEIEILSKNPNVFQVTDHSLYLTLEMRQKIYDEWVIFPSSITVKRVLEESGIDPNMLGPNYCINIAGNFKRSGRPKRLITIDQQAYPRSADTTDTKEVLPATKDKAEAGRRHQKPGAENEAELPEELLRVLFTAYPETPVLEGMKANGYRQDYISACEVRRLSRIFGECKMIGTTPWECRERCSEIPIEQRSLLRGHPFVIKVDLRKIHLNGNFYEAAAVLKDLKIDNILALFSLEPTCFTRTEKIEIHRRLEATESPTSAAGSFGNTRYDALLLQKRIAALNDLARKGFEELRLLVPSLSRAQKKKLCLLLNEMLSDPEHEYTAAKVLPIVGISNSAYYKYLNDPDYGLGETRRQEQEQIYRKAVAEAFYYKGFRKGSRQVCMLVYRNTGMRPGLKKVRRIMKELGLDAGVRKPNPARQSQKSRMEGAIKPDLLRRRFRLYRPNKVRVTDVTYLDYGDGKRAYGSALMDPVTGRLITFYVSENNDLNLALETLKAADDHPCADGGIFHSDQGVLYQADQFQKEILSRGLRQSMSKKGNCWDNATQESFFGHFKDECSYASIKTIDELKEVIERYSWYYNNERGLWDRSRMTPIEYEAYLLSLSDDEFSIYLAAEEKKYNEMKERAAELAKKRYGTLGVQEDTDEQEFEED